MEDDLFDLKVNNRKDFIKFINALHTEFLKNGSEWENNTLERFLEAMTAYSEDIQGYYNNCEDSKDANMPTWQTFADIITGAIIYE